MDEVTELALAAAAGDGDALAHFVRATQADVWRFCAHLSDRGSADDLTQDVYARAIPALSRFHGQAGARAWLLTIARRTVADHIRRQQRRRRLPTAAEDVAPTAAGDEQVALLAVIAQLENDRRVAFVLTQLLGLSYAEAAQVCRCPVGTIRSRIARARDDLVAAISDDGDGTSNLGP